MPIQFCSGFIFQTFLLHYQHHPMFKPGPPVYLPSLPLQNKPHVLDISSPLYSPKVFYSTKCKTSSCKNLIFKCFEMLPGGKKMVLLILVYPTCRESWWDTPNICHLQGGHVALMAAGHLDLVNHAILVSVSSIGGKSGAWKGLLICPKLVAAWRKRQMLYWSAARGSSEIFHSSSVFNKI